MHGKSWNIQLSIYKPELFVLAIIEVDKHAD